MARAALIAQENLEASDADASFYHAKISTARFYADHILAQAPGLRSAIVSGSAGVLSLNADQF
jgi:butyryl-CoA dehydrogenase